MHTEPLAVSAHTEPPRHPATGVQGIAHIDPVHTRPSGQLASHVSVTSVHTPGSPMQREPLVQSLAVVHCARQRPKRQRRPSAQAESSAHRVPIETRPSQPSTSKRQTVRRTETTDATGNRPKQDDTTAMVAEGSRAPAQRTVAWATDTKDPSRSVPSATSSRCASEATLVAPSVADTGRSRIVISGAASSAP